jgi:chaperonin GroEL (HSP60 family)
LDFENFTQKNKYSNHEYTLVLAAASIANIVKSSLGPVGLDKMLVDEIGVNIFKLHINICCFN